MKVEGADFRDTNVLTLITQDEEIFFAYEQRRRSLHPDKILSLMQDSGLLRNRMIKLNWR